MATSTMMNPNPALNLFYQRLTSRWRSTLGRIFYRSSHQLLDLSALAQRWTIRGRHSIGRQIVPIAAILGSESRVTDFDRGFRPCAKHLAERWCRVAEGWENGASLPPVELICVGDRYFVRDGHHRISVAATFGALEIEALVTVWEVDGPLPSAHRTAVPMIQYERHDGWTTERAPVV
jgi:hypothetical protein